MPYKFETKKIKIPRQYDKRIKLRENHLSLIKHLYFNERLPIREIARRLEKKCSRRMIQFILFPERLEKVKERAKEVKRWQLYNQKEYHTPAMRRHRKYKSKLYKNALLYC